jgi:tetratricopeptide (TPR) repeat protein
MPAEIAAQSPSTPVWLRYIDAYCRYDTNFLRSASEAHTRHSQLALLLSVLSVTPSNATQLVIARSREALERMPECFVLYDILFHLQQLSIDHVTTVEAPATMARTVRDRVAALPHLPRSVKSTVGRVGGLLGQFFKQEDDDPAAQATIVRALIQAGQDEANPADPSWSILGRMLQEQNFMLVYHRAEFMKNRWSVPTGGYVDEVLPLVADHPYAGFIKAYGIDYRAQREKFNQAVKDLNLVDVVPCMMPIVRATWEANTPGKIQGPTAYQRMYKHLSNDANGACAMYYSCDEKYKKEWAHRWLELSPKCPAAMAGLIAYDWDFAKPHAQEWEKQYGYYPAMLWSLGYRYQQLKQYDEAERCYRAYIKLSPDSGAYDQLAGMYWERGDHEGWVKTEQESLKKPDYGLNHARTQCRIARYYMDKQQWQKAIPYADAAAGTWAGWAMDYAVEAHEGAGEWGTAEQWIQRISERYEGQEANWFLWCKRTGHGDAESAQKRAAVRLKTLLSAGDYYGLEEATVLTLLMDRPKEALGHAKDSYAKSKYARTALHAAVLAGSLKDIPTRDQVLQSILDKGPTTKDYKNYELVMIELARIVRKAIAANPAEPLDAGLIDNWFTSVPEDDQTNQSYFAGMFALQLGDEALGRKYLLKATHGVTGTWTCTLARRELRRRGIPVETQPATEAAK